MTELFEPNDSSEHRLQRLIELNRQLDEIIRGGDAKLDSLKARIEAHAAQSSYAVAIENIRLQRKISKLTIIILVFTIVAAIAGTVQAVCAVASYRLALHQQKIPPSVRQAR